MDACRDREAQPDNRRHLNVAVANLELRKHWKVAERTAVLAQRCVDTGRNSQVVRGMKFPLKWKRRPTEVHLEIQGKCMDTAKATDNGTCSQ
jgi:hypothetical protein